MNKILITLFVLALVSLTGCAGSGIQAWSVPGGVYSEYTAPYMDATTSTANVPATKKGQAQCVSVLGAIATGNCGVKEAQQNGNIRQVHHVDFHIKNILGVYAEYTTIVYGQ